MKLGPAEWAAIMMAAAMLMPRITWLRTSVALAGMFGLGSALAEGQRLDAVLYAVLAIAALLPFAQRLWSRMTVAFTAEEEMFRVSHVPTLDRVAARHLLDQGHWISAAAGDELIRENAAVENFFFLAQGAADVRADGALVGQCGAGELIGEASALDGGKAMATVTMREAGRLWFISAPALRAYIEAHPDVEAALQHGFVAALRSKLKTTNARLAGGRG